MKPHDFQRAGLAYCATDAGVTAGQPGGEEAELAHWLQISGRYWYKPLAMRGYAAPWFFLHDAGLLVIWGQKAIRPHAAALSWNPPQQAAYDDYATYLGRLARVPLIESIRRWLGDLRSELQQRGLSDEARAQAELQVILACLEWLLDTIEPAIGWRRLATDLRWQSSADAEAVLMNPVGDDPESAARNLRKGLTPDGETPPERPFTNFLRQLIGTGELLWKPTVRADVTRRWFNEIAIRAASDFHGTVRTNGQRRRMNTDRLTPMASIVPDAAMRTRALRPLDTALIERYLNRQTPTADDQIQMELDYARQEQIVDIENPMRTFIEGLSGIARRGPLSAMLRRELADDDLFYAKFADNSLLYFSRPELLSVPYSLFMGILVDSSLNAALPDGTSARSVAKELALYLLDTTRLIPSVAPGLPVDAYLFQFSDQGAEYQSGAQSSALAQLGLSLSPTPEALPGEFWLNLNEPPDNLRDPWLLRSDVLAASYFNLATIAGHEHPPVNAWDTSGVVYPMQPPHAWDSSMPTREGSRLTGKLAVLSGDSLLLTVKAIQASQPDQQIVVTRAQPALLDYAFPAGSTYQLSVEASGYAPVGYRLNLRLSPGARSLHIGPHIWPAMSRLAHVAGQRLAQREADTDQSSAYSLAHLVLITSDDFTMADPIQCFVRGEFEAISEQVTIHIFRLSSSKGTISWQLDRGDYRRIKPPQPESLDVLRRQSRIRIQFWRELRRDLESLGD